MRAGERGDHPIELLSASIDRELRPAEAAALESHLEGCAECRGLLGDFRNLDAAIASEPSPPIPVGLEEKILAAVGERETVRPRPLWRQVMPAAAAASLVMAVALWFARPDRLPPLTEPVAPIATGHPSVPSSTGGESTPVTSPGAVVSPGPGASPRMQAQSPSKPAAPSVARPAPSMEPPALPAPPAVASPGEAPSSPTPDAKDSAAKDKDEAASEARSARLEAAEAAKEPAPEAKVDQAEGNWTFESPGGSVPDAEAEKRRQQEAAAAQQEAATKDLQRAGAERRIASAPSPQAKAAPSAVAGAAPGMTAVSLPLPRPVGVFARPYVVTLESDSVMQVHRGTYNCTVPIEISDGRVVTAAVNEILGSEEAGSRARSLNPAPAATIVTATPQARESILRLVRETYRPVLESRCGPLPN